MRFKPCARCGAKRRERIYYNGAVNGTRRCRPVCMECKLHYRRKAMAQRSQWAKDNGIRPPESFPKFLKHLEDVVPEARHEAQ